MEQLRQQFVKNGVNLTEAKMLTQEIMGRGVLTSVELAKLHGVKLGAALLWLRTKSVPAKKVRGIWLIGIADALSFQRPSRGGGHKLTDAQVVSIRREMVTGSAKDVSKRYGVSENLVYRIMSGDRHKL